MFILKVRMEDLQRRYTASHLLHDVWVQRDPECYECKHWVMLYKHYAAKTRLECWHC